MTSEYAFTKRPTRLVPIPGANGRAEAFEKTDSAIADRLNEVKEREKERKRRKREEYEKNKGKK